MPERILLGMLPPSSNTVLEPVTSAMLAGLCHTRFGAAQTAQTVISTPAPLGALNDSKASAAACRAVDNIRYYNRRAPAVADDNCHYNYRHQADRNYCRLLHRLTHQ